MLAEAIVVFFTSCSFHPVRQGSEFGILAESNDHGHVQTHRICSFRMLRAGKSCLRTITGTRQRVFVNKPVRSDHVIAE